MMFTSILNPTSFVAVKDVALLTACSIVFGFLLAITYILTKGKYTKSFAITLVILPAVVQIVVMMVNGSIGAGIAIAGAFSLIRFRSQPASSKELTTLFLAMALGICNAMGFITISLFLTVVFCVLIYVLERSKFGEKKTVSKILRVSIPENLDFAEIFDDLFETYTETATLDRVKTTNMGSMFELTYVIELKKGVNEKAFMDEIRCRNGNLTVQISRPLPEVNEI